MELAQDTALREHLSSHVRAMDFGDRSWLSIAKNTLQVYRSAVTSYSSPASSPSTEGDTGKQ
jgi:gamma-glutamylcysteine synthetase